MDNEDTVTEDKPIEDETTTDAEEMQPETLEAPAPAILEGHQIDIYPIQEAEGAGPKRIGMEEGSTGRFVMQTHQRGDSIHTDLRMLVEKPLKATHLEGLTLFTPGTEDKRNKALNPQSGEAIQITPKAFHELRWMEMGVGGKTTIPAGSVAATKNEPGVFEKVASGTFEILERRKNYSRWNFTGPKFNGVWTFSQAKMGDDMVWLFRKVEG